MPEPRSGTGGGRWYRFTVPFRLVLMVAVGLFDAAFMVMILVMSLSAALADFLLSPSHWRERPSAVKVPRPWEMPRAVRELYAYHWRALVRPRPRHRPSPSELWP
jgi:hypothetical protein